ncbi:MAG: cell wall-binding repeat-containing protein [Acidimicrobiia bacterium]|nr:cell wall-binding repeat-containing protein [Acidimicrobiia bacterium]
MPSNRRAPRAAIGLVVALLLSACAGDVGIAPPEGFTTPTIDPEILDAGFDLPVETGATTTTAPVRTACEAPILTVAAEEDRTFDRLGSDPTATSVAVSASTFACTEDVVVAPADDPVRATLAGRLAVAIGAPLLFGGPEADEALEAEVARLAPSTAFFVGGGLDVTLPRFTELREFAGSDADIAAAIDELLSLSDAVDLPAEASEAELVVAAVEAMISGRGLVPIGGGGTTTTLPDVAPGGAAGSVGGDTTTTSAPEPEPTEDDRDGVPLAYVGTGQSGRVWLTAGSDAVLGLPTMAAAAASGGLAALVDGADLRTIPEIGRAIQGSAGGAAEVFLVGEMTEDAEWQVDMIADAPEIFPGAGWLLFPRRLVALYGHPGAAVLGVLGEQGPEASVELARRLAAPYGADGVEVWPAFEIIATIASSAAGADGDYSDEATVDYLRPWVDVAKEAGIYVILDLQPGRTDFLTQAKRYEELLLEPHVGLALDPEWRLEPDQFHLRQIGAVQPEEVNTVSEWLSGFVRDNDLPQKMFLLHQFRMDMLPNRDRIETPAELATVIQMDGQGALPVKYDTWGVITRGWEDFGWQYGWKNFFDEDSPTPTPEIVLDLTPLPVLVSYQ